MKRIGLAGLISLFIFSAAGLDTHARAAKSAEELEKDKAMVDPYANDLGPDEINAKVLASYPKPAQAGYKVMREKCSKCHSASRPLNSQFVETAGKKSADRQASLGKLKKAHPDLFADKNVWQIETKIWKRYVKRMMAKPGCEISKAEGKQIWQFISHDARARKLGKNKKKWATHRKKLLAEFKKKHPARYKKLYEKHKKKGKKPTKK